MFLIPVSNPKNMNHVFIRICLYGCLLTSILAHQRQTTGIELASNGSIHVSILLTKQGIGNTTRASEDDRVDLNKTRMSAYGRVDLNKTRTSEYNDRVDLNKTRTSEYDRVDLIPTSELGTSYIIFPPLAFNNSSRRCIEVFLVAVYDNTSVTAIHTDVETTTTIELDSFETFAIKRTTFDKSGIRILSSHPIAVFIVDDPRTKFCDILASEKSYSNTEATQNVRQFHASDAVNPESKAQADTSEAKASTTVSQILTYEASTPSVGATLSTHVADDLSGYYTVMQIPPDIHWSDTYRLEMMDCPRDQILVGIAAASVNVTRVRLKGEKTAEADRVITLTGNQMTHVFLTFNNKMASVNIEADDRIQLLIYDDTQPYTEADKDRSTRKTFVPVSSSSASVLPSHNIILIPSVCSNDSHSGSLLCNSPRNTVEPDRPSSNSCRLAITRHQKHEFNLNEEEDGSNTTETKNETRNLWVVNYKHNYTFLSSQQTIPSSTPSESFYQAANRTLLSIANRPQSLPRYSQNPPSSGVGSDQTVPMARPNLTDVFQRVRTTAFTFSSEYHSSEERFGNRVNEDVDRSTKGIARRELTEHRSESEEKRGVYDTAVHKRNPGISSTIKTLDAFFNVSSRRVRENRAEEMDETNVKESPTAVSPSSSLSKLFNVSKTSDVQTTSVHKLHTPLKFIYRPYIEKDIQPTRPSVHTNSQPVTNVPDSATLYNNRPIDEKTRLKQNIVHKTISLFVVKQDSVDKSGHKVVSYFEIDAAQVDPYSAQDRGISPTVIAVITSLCGAVFFVIACILGFVVTEVLCAKGRLQRAKVSPCIDISNAGY